MYARLLRLLLFLACVLAIPISGPALSQSSSNACPQIVETALATIDQLCSDVDLNGACYGHMLIDAVPRMNAVSFDFDNEGDTTRLVDLETLRLSSMNLEAGTWGMALLRIRAYLLYAAPQDVTVLLFGDTEIEDATAQLPELPVRVLAREYVNTRISPYADAGVLEVVAPGQALTATGRTAESDWLQVELPDTGRIGWIEASNVASNPDIPLLAVKSGTTPYYGPMQAFYFESGSDDAACPESPQSGLLIQTPEGVAEVTLLVNEVSIEMRATAFMQAQPGGEMSFRVLEGWAEVEAGGWRQPVFAGTEVTIPMSETLGAAGVPSRPVPYSTDTIQSLPVGVMSRDVEIAQPLGENQVAQRIQEWDEIQLALYQPVEPVAVSADGAAESPAASSDAASSDGSAQQADQGTVVAVTSGDTGGDTGDDIDCSNPPPPHAPAGGWHAKCG